LRRLIRKMIRNAGFVRRVAPSFVEVIAANNVDIVLDVGANDGDYGRDLRDEGYRGRIHSFEPLPSAYERLSRSIWDDPLWDAVPYGVGDQPGTLQLNISNADVFSSFKQLNEFGQASANAKVVDTVEAQVVRLDQYLVDPEKLLTY